MGKYIVLTSCLDLPAATKFAAFAHHTMVHHDEPTELLVKDQSCIFSQIVDKSLVMKLGAIQGQCSTIRSFARTHPL